MDLVVLAGGIGSRFGGLKQMESVDDEGNFLVDYSIFDAIKYGFDRVIFVINEKNEKDFKDSIGKRIKEKIKVEYVFQKADVVTGLQKSDRTKPLGTGHALLCCKEIVKGNFVMINADDFYGKDAFKKASIFLKKQTEDFMLMAYKLKSTINGTGEEKRGVINREKGYLKNIEEKIISTEKGGYFCQSLDRKEKEKIHKNSLVSMNFFCFSPKIFSLLEKDFNEFLLKKNLQKDEFMLPNAINAHIQNEIKMKVSKSNYSPMGLTFKEDILRVRREIIRLKKQRKYPSKLWN